VRSLDRTPQHATAQQSVRRVGSVKIEQMELWNPPRYLRRGGGWGGETTVAVGISVLMFCIMNDVFGLKL
jgi:hypothetical protein